MNCYSIVINSTKKGHMVLKVNHTSGERTEVIALQIAGTVCVKSCNTV